ncbi:MAG: Rieske (2Fe-2S) protein, partial [Micromonosporaceae bacterium]|nr:Rieske (2Fe-2S) protein [Micromonosporaceae bacterium]
MSGSLRSALVCSVEDLAVGSVRAVQVDGLAIAVVRTSDGAVHAVRDQCTHGRV